MRHFLLLGYVFVLLGAMQSAAQWAAARLAHPASLGPRITLGGLTFYPPWSWLRWRPILVANPSVFRGACHIVLIAVVLGMLPIALARPFKPRVAEVGKNHWATLTDMRRAGLLDGRGTVIGRHRGRLLTFAGPEHQLIAGATRSGKGTGHVVPTQLTWPGSTVTYDPKGELWEITAGYRARFSHCLFFNPTRVDSVRYNPLLEVRKGPQEVRDTQNIVEMLVNVDGAKQTLDVWDQHASQLLTALALHVLYTEQDDRKHLGVVRELLLDARRTLPAMVRTPHRINPASGRAEPHPEVARVARELIQQAPKFAAGVRATAQGFLALYADPIVLRNVSVSDFRIGDLVCSDRPVSLYLQAPPSDADRLRPLMRLMINQICRSFMEHIDFDNRGGRKLHSLLLAMDEFASLGRLEFFVTNLRQMAGYGLKCQLVVQSLNDLAEKYGPHNTILDNCHVIASFACADALTADRLSKMTGVATEYRSSYSRKRRLASFGADSISQAEHVRPLLHPGDIRKLGPDEQLLFVTGFPPMRTRKVRYYADPEFRGRILSPPSQAQSIDSPTPADPRFGVVHDWLGERAKGQLQLTDELLAPSDDDDWREPMDPASPTQLGLDDEYAL